MPADPRLLIHPVVLAEAERLARELWETEVSILAEEEPDLLDYKWTGSAESIEAQARLLADPSREATRDWLARSGAAEDPCTHPEAVLDADGWFIVYAEDGELLGLGAERETAEYDAREYLRAWWHRHRDDPDALVPRWLEVHADQARVRAAKETP